jgi:four helix bundle protein
LLRDLHHRARFPEAYHLAESSWPALDIGLAIDSMESHRYAGLKSQILRAAASIPANIAEGCGKRTDAELARYSEIALGSTTELDNHLLFARDARVLAADRYVDLEPRIIELRKMLFSFVRAVRARASER